MKTYYIITAHNSEQLIARVISGVIMSHNNLTEGKILLVADGCSDETAKRAKDYFELWQRSEEGVVGLELIVLTLPNVHEIESINHALTHIRTFEDPRPEDLVFMLQDDVVLDEVNINNKIADFYYTSERLGYISLRMGVDVKLLPVRGAEYNTNIYDYNVTESEFGHWSNLGWKEIHNQPIIYVRHGEHMYRDIVVRSPTVCRWNVFEDVGVFDAALAPYNYDCFDFSIRCLERGYHNAVYALKFESDLSWGGMRKHEKSKFNEKKEEIFDRNLKYMMNKHRNFLTDYTRMKLEHENTSMRGKEV